MNSIERSVTEARAALGLEGFSGDDGILRLVESMRGQLRVYELEGLARAFMRKWRDGTATILTPPNCPKFVLHEVGHYLHNSGRMGAIHCLEHTAEGATERRNEARAHAFLLAWLAPWELCYNLTAPELAEAAGISLEWATERLRQVAGMFEAI